MEGNRVAGQVGRCDLKSLFLAVNESLRWLNNVSCLFLSFPEYNSLIKVDWLDACIALRVVELYWLFSSGVRVKFAQSPSQWEARADIPIKPVHAANII